MQINYETIKKKAIQELYWNLGGNGSGIGFDNVAFLALVEMINQFSTGEIKLPPKMSKMRDWPLHIVKEWQQVGSNIIANWDIRRIKTLIELFPSCVNKKCHNASQIIADYNEKGEWIVIFI